MINTLILYKNYTLSPTADPPVGERVNKFFQKHHFTTLTNNFENIQF